MRSLGQIGLGMDRAAARMSGRVAGLAQPHQDVRRLDQRFGARDADRFDLIVGLTQAGGVGQQDRHAAKRQRHLDMVARGARNIGDDRPLLASYRIDKA